MTRFASIPTVGVAAPRGTGAFAMFKKFTFTGLAGTD